jgi:hypothetical protein
MTPIEVGRVLVKASAFDQRTVGEVDIMAWHEILRRVEYADALEAVTRHYTETRERLMPADVIRHARSIREDRRGKEIAGRSDALALPSRYETDEERNVRIKAGVTQCRDALGPVMDMLAARRERHRREQEAS